MDNSLFRALWTIHNVTRAGSMVWAMFSFMLTRSHSHSEYSQKLLKLAKYMPPEVLLDRCLCNNCYPDSGWLNQIGQLKFNSAWPLLDPSSHVYGYKESIGSSWIDRRLVKQLAIHWVHVHSTETVSLHNYNWPAEVCRITVHWIPNTAYSCSAAVFISCPLAS